MRRTFPRCRRRCGADSLVKTWHTHDGVLTLLGDHVGILLTPNVFGYLAHSYGRRSVLKWRERIVNSVHDPMTDMPEMRVTVVYCGR